MADNIQEAQTFAYNKPAIPETQRNAYAQIWVLSDDLLAEIFLTLKNNVYVESVQSWYPITQVCRHWRHVALGLANLWTEPPTNLHELTCLMLERSQKSPLDISISHSTSKPTCTAILSHIGRIRVLNVKQPKEDLEHLQRILLALKEEATYFMKLTIVPSDWRSNGSFRLSASTLRQLPSLKTLWLSCIDFDWDTLPIRGLTSLSLTGVSLSNPPSWTQFRQTLSEMPSLEDLFLNLSDLNLPIPSGPLKLLELPLLRKLEIEEGHASAVRALLSNSTSPRLHNAWLGCLFGETSDPDDYPTTIAVILSLITKGNFGRLDKLDIGPDDAFSVMAKNFTGIGWEGRRDIGIIASNRYNVDIFSSVQTFMAGFSALRGNLTSEIVHLSLSEALTSEQIVELFGHLPQVESITVMRIHPKQTIKSLQISPLHLSGSPIPFAKLRSLEFDRSYYPDEHTPELLEDLSICLAQRRKFGAAISNLVVCRNWGPDSEEARRLQKLISDIKEGWLPRD